MFNGRVSTSVRLLLSWTALFLLPTATSTQIDNCCFVDRQCSTNYDWVSGYYAFQNNHCAAPSQQQPQSTASQPPASASEVIDNCCFVGWQCATDEEWTNGYWAYQNNQCPGAQNSRSQSRAVGPATEEVNNCCFIGWQCSSDEEWTSGYYAFQLDNCDPPTLWPGQWQQQTHEQYGNRRAYNKSQQRHSGNQNQPEQLPVSITPEPTNPNPGPDPTDPCAGRPRGYPDDPRLDCYFVARNCSWFCRTKKNP